MDFRNCVGYATLILLFASCVESATTAPPVGADRYYPPPIYARWWSTVESCSGISGSLPDISFYVLQGATSIPSVGEFAGGYWQAQGNQIVLIGETQMSGPLVRHEMLHALLRTKGHSRQFFLRRCAGVVECIDQCIDDADPPPKISAGTPTVPAESLQINISTQPTNPSSTYAGGYFTITVTAHNPAAHAVVLAPPLVVDQLPPATFGLLFGNENSGYGFFDHAWDVEATRFAQGETKREIFDFAIGRLPGAIDLTPGAYELRGGYGSHMSQSIKVTVRP